MSTLALFDDYTLAVCTVACPHTETDGIDALFVLQDGEQILFLTLTVAIVGTGSRCVPTDVGTKSEAVFVGGAIKDCVGYVLLLCRCLICHKK